MFIITLSLIIFHISLLPLSKSTLTVLAPPLLEIITLTTLARLNQKNDSFSIRGAKMWNSIPENLRNSSKYLFKEKVHAILLKIFDAQDSYADLNTIISDFKKY